MPNPISLSSSPPTSYSQSELNSGTATFYKIIDSIGFTFGGVDGYSFANNYGSNYKVFPNIAAGPAATWLTIGIAAGHTFDLTGFGYYTTTADTITVTFSYADNTSVTGTLLATPNTNVSISDFSVFHDAANHALPGMADDVVQIEIRSNNGTGGFDFGTNRYGIEDVRTIPDATSTVTAGPSAEASSLPTTATSAASAVALLDFTITDAGTLDNAATGVSALYASVSGSATAAELALMRFVLSGPDASDVAGTYDSASGRVIFSGLNLSIADHGSASYSIKAYYNDAIGSNDIGDHHTVALSLNASNFSTVAASSTFAAGQANVSSGSGASVDVVATKLVFSQAPSGTVTSGASFASQPVVFAVDEHGNIDTDFNGVVTLSINGSGSGALGGVIVLNAVNGVATFNGVHYNAASDADADFVLTAASAGLASAVSAAIDPDVVASKLVFATQPAPAAIHDGQNSAFSTVPVVQAVDANGLLDQDYAGNIVLSLTDPLDGNVGGAVNGLAVSAGDLDASATTVTLAAAGGSATYSGLHLSYANGGATDTLALLATSGGLASASSATLTVVPPNHAPTIAQPGGYAAPVNYATGAQPLAVALADLNGDGKLDLVSANAASNQLSVLLGNGDGSFNLRTDIAAGNNPRSVAVADINGDGKLDLIAANGGGNAVTLLINDGSGTAFTAVSHAVGLAPLKVAAADLNGDGRADVVVANGATSNVSVLLNNGAGGLDPALGYATGGSPASVQVVDVNGDGRVDLVTSNAGSDTVSVLLGAGDGSFGTRTDYASGAGPLDLVAADFNGDGQIDLAVANADSNSVSVLTGRGDGSFNARVDYAMGAMPGAIAAADVDGDGHTDLVVVERGAGKLALLTGKGDGSFNARTELAAGAAHALALADLNGDGKPDIVATDASGNTVSVLLNHASGVTAFTEQTTVTISSTLLIADADGDGDWQGGQLTVQISGNSEAADQLLLATSNPGGGGIWLDAGGNKLMAGATQIGTASAAAGSGGAAWTFSFNANASNALVQDVARALRYNNSSDAPGSADRTLTLTVTDQHAASASITHTITVSAVNDAPVNSLPGAQSTAAGATLVFDSAHGNAIRVSDADGGAGIEQVSISVAHGTLTLGSIAGLTFSTGDGSADMLMTFSGTLASINAALNGLAYAPDAGYSGSDALQIISNDLGNAGVGGAISDTDSIAIRVRARPTTPTNPQPSPDADGVPDAIEDAAPGLPLAGGGVIAGDGNGDGVADSRQSNVASAAFLHTDQVTQHPGAGTVYVTLVADSVDGKVDTSAAIHATLNNVRQLDAPADKPADLNMPLGLISFSATLLAAGATESFSLYVDGNVAVNGYWKQTSSGNWVNLASAEFGGKVVVEGGKTRLDFLLTDGGMFDSDGKADGVITDPGAPGYRAATPGDSDNDQFPDALEAANGLVVGVKDNDVFGSSKLFVMQLYRDLLFREAEPSGLQYWQTMLDAGTDSQAYIISGFLHSSEFQHGAGSIARLYLGALERAPDAAGLAYWMDKYQSGQTLQEISTAFAGSAEFAASHGTLDDRAYISVLYDSVLQRSGAAQEINYWLDQMAHGASRGEVLLNFTESAESQALQASGVDIALDFAGLLGRTPSASEFSHWVGLQDGGASEVAIIGQFLASAEFHDRFLPLMGN